MGTNFSLPHRFQTVSVVFGPRSRWVSEALWQRMKRPEREADRNLWNCTSAHSGRVWFWKLRGFESFCGRRRVGDTQCTYRLCDKLHVCVCHSFWCLLIAGQNTMLLSDPQNQKLFFLVFRQYSSNRKIFQIQVVDINENCILCTGQIYIRQPVFEKIDKIPFDLQVVGFILNWFEEKLNDHNRFSLDSQWHISPNRV
jgi:hypothetical protein